VVGDDGRDWVPRESNKGMADRVVDVMVGAGGAVRTDDIVRAIFPNAGAEELRRRRNNLYQLLRNRHDLFERVRNGVWRLRKDADQ